MCDNDHRISTLLICEIKLKEELKRFHSPQVEAIILDERKRIWKELHTLMDVK